MSKPAVDDSAAYTADMMSGPVLFGGIGFAVDHWVFTDGHRGVIVGLIIGLVISSYAVFIRYHRAMTKMEAEQAQAVPATKAGVFGESPRPARRASGVQEGP